MRRLLSLALMLVVVPQWALAATVYLRQERDGQGVENVGDEYTSDNGYADAATVPKGYPTEPKGCKPASTGEACSLANSADYGWPYSDVVLSNEDAYGIVSNFWNNEATLGDTTMYIPGAIKAPFDRLVYTSDHVQFVTPSDAFIDRWTVVDSAGGRRPSSPYVTGSQVIQVEDTSGFMQVSSFDGNAIADGGDRNDGSTLTWIDERHYPSTYPFTFKGCHQGTCTKDGSGASSGAPFPIQVRDLGSIPSDWHVTLPTDTTSVFDVAYDIWFDIGYRSYQMANPWEREYGPYFAGLPEANKVLTQPYGTELMIWINAAGFTGWNGGDISIGAITPAGPKSDMVFTASDGSLWDVYIAQARDPKPSEVTGDDWNGYWNIVSFVKQEPSTSFTLDTKQFIDFMRTGMSDRCPVAYANGSAIPNQTNAPCVEDTWWLSEIGAGFEIWRGGAGLRTDTFTVKPTFNTVYDAAHPLPTGIAVMTDRWTEDSPARPLINWQKYIQLWADGFCPAGAATYDIRSAESFRTDSSGNILEWCPTGVGRWSTSGLSKTSACATATGDPGASHRAMVNVNGRTDQWYAILPNNQRMWDLGMHGNTDIHFYCDGVEDTSKTVSLFIDPSGGVYNEVNGVKGGPIPNAIVTLYVLGSDGQWQVAQNTATETIMSPNNTDNPDYTSSEGYFGWDVIAGSYVVTAEKEGCYVPGDPSQPVAATDVLLVTDGNPITGLDLRLYCPPPEITPDPNDGLPVGLYTFNNWATGSKYGKGGYCNFIYVTNNTGAAVTNWKGVVQVTDGDIYSPFNVVVSGNTVTANAPSWCSTLNPGQTSMQTCGAVQGYCVERK